MPTTDPVIATRNKLASLTRWGPGDTNAITQARRDLNAAHVERAIQRALAAAPPLSADQRDRLASLLRPGVA